MTVFLNNLVQILDTTTTAVEHVGDNVCSDAGVMKAIRLVGYLLYVAKFFVPVIIIVWGTLDLYKAVTKAGADELMKQAKVLGVRCLLGLAIFLLPNIINWTLTSIGTYEDDNTACIQCLLEPFSCNP